MTDITTNIKRRFRNTFRTTDNIDFTEGSDWLEDEWELNLGHREATKNDIDRLERKLDRIIELLEDE